MRARPSLVPALAILVALAQGTQTSRRLSVAVLDENGVAVRGARVTLQLPSPAQALRCETEISGRCELSHIPSGPCQIHVEKEGYYVANSSVEPSGSSEIEITLNHLKEIKETVDVHESPPMIPECEIDADGAAPPYKTFRRLFDGFFRSAIQRARLSEAEVAAWLKSLEQADAEGVFQNGAVVFTVVGQKP